MEKLNLANLPTPIIYLEDLSKELNKNIYVKRDDFSGMELSGNKIRKLEYSLAEALELNCDTVITTGAIQSNHCRATAFAARKLGLTCQLVLAADEVNPYELEGNTFFDLMAGAEVYLIPSDSDRYAFMDKLAERASKEGRKAYLIPIGASNAVGSLGYMDCYKEILEQEVEMGVNFDVISLGVGSGGTFAGLYFENDQQVVQKEILGISVSASAEEFTDKINNILQEMYNEFMPNSNFHARKFSLIDEYIGEGYAKTNKWEISFLIDIAQKTGIVFDPCYTGKAFRGLIGEVKKGKLDFAENILFIHTGGIFGWTKENRTLALDTLLAQFHRI